MVGCGGSAQRESCGDVCRLSDETNSPKFAPCWSADFTVSSTKSCMQFGRVVVENNSLKLGHGFGVPARTVQARVR
jgi:hypothetical protein